MTEGTLDDQENLGPIDSDQRRLLLSRGPKEARELAASFYGLLDRLAAARQRVIESDRLAMIEKICLPAMLGTASRLGGLPPF